MFNKLVCASITLTKGMVEGTKCSNINVKKDELLCIWFNLLKINNHFLVNFSKEFIYENKYIFSEIII